MPRSIREPLESQPLIGLVLNVVTAYHAKVTPARAPKPPY